MCDDLFINTTTTTTTTAKQVNKIFNHTYGDSHIHTYIIPKQIWFVKEESQKKKRKRFYLLITVAAVIVVAGLVLFY